MDSKYEWSQQLIDLIKIQLCMTEEQAVSNLNLFGHFVGLPTEYQPWVPQVASHLVKGWEAISNNLLDDEEINMVISIAKIISNLKGKSFKRTPQDEWFGHEQSAEKIKDNPMRGNKSRSGFSKYPLYSLLIQLHPDQNIQVHFRKIQFQLASLLFSYQKSKGFPKFTKDKLSSINRIFRKVCQKDRGGQNESIIVALNPKHFCEGDPEKCLRPGYSLTDSSEINAIVKFICFLAGNDLYRHPDFSERRSSLKLEKQYAYYPGNYLPDPADVLDEDNHGPVDDLIITNSENLPNDKVKEDLPKDFNHPGARVIVSNREKGPSGPLFARYQHNHITMANQCLGLDELSYSSAEMAIIMKVVTDRLKKDLNTVYNNKELIKRIQCGVILLLQVWVGLTFSQARLVYIVKKKNKSDGGPIKLYEEGGNYYWLKSIPKPKVKSYVQHHPEICRDMDQLLQIEDVFNISQYFIFLTKMVDGDKYIYSMEGVDHKGGVYKQYLKDIEEKIKKQFRVFIYLTDSKLSYFLAESIIRIHGDPTDALYLTGKQLAPCGTQIFYYMPKISYLENVYRTAVLNRLEEIYAEGLFNKKEFKVTCSNNNKSIGLGNCPTIKYLKQIFNDIRVKINDKTVSAINKHNLYVAYVVLTIGYLTAIRANVNPCPPKPWCENSNNFIILSDKDGLATKEKVESFYHTRIIPKTKNLMRQLELWDSYQNRFIQSCKKQKIRPPKKFNKQERTLLFLDENGEHYKVATPTDIEKILKPFYGLKLNSNRRFLRTELKERGVNHEMVDAFMSHSSHGQESWGKFSAFEPEKYLEVITSALESIAEDVGIVAFASPFKRIPNFGAVL